MFEPSEAEYAALVRRLRPTEYDALVERLRRPSLTRQIAALLF